jgi:hypothetical protein
MTRIVVLLSIILTFCTTAAEARHRHTSHHHHYKHRVQVAKTTNFTFGCSIFTPCSYQRSLSPRNVRVNPQWGDFTAPALRVAHAWRHHRSHVQQASYTSGQVVGSRPSDCYGIPWCGCFLRHYFGIADKSLNLARAWASVGSNAGGPSVGVVVVWRHHVGKIVGQDARGNWIVLSGNSGRGGITERPLSFRGVIAFRRV